MKPGQSYTAMMPLKYPVKGSPKPRIAVIGAGVIGLATAVRVAEKLPGHRVDLISERFSPHTTGDGSAGFWNPYLPGDIPEPTLRKWGKETFNFLANICFSANAASYGVNLISAMCLQETKEPPPSYYDIFLNFHELSPKELERFPSKYKYGQFYTTMIVECKKFLPKLMERFLAVGGQVQQRKVEALSELSPEYDVVVVCTGVESGKLTDDPLLTPVRGQVFKVRAPWIKHAYITETCHILPNSEIVTLGGTKQVGDWNTQVDPRDSSRIWAECLEIIPSLKDAEVVEQWVGLRPGRTAPRLEVETLYFEGSKPLQVVHHYGHGGSGVTLFWGSAGQAAALVVDVVKSLRDSAMARL